MMDLTKQHDMVALLRVNGKTVQGSKLTIQPKRYGQSSGFSILDQLELIGDEVSFRTATYMDVSDSRVLNREYTNETGKVMVAMVSVALATPREGGNLTFSATVNGVVVAEQKHLNTNTWAPRDGEYWGLYTNPNATLSLEIIIPPGGVYQFNGTGRTVAVTRWVELASSPALEEAYTWIDRTTSRAFNTNYTNNTQYPVDVAIVLERTAVDANALDPYSFNISDAPISVTTIDNVVGAVATVYCRVLPSQRYRLVRNTADTTVKIAGWKEMVV